MTKKDEPKDLQDAVSKALAILENGKDTSVAALRQRQAEAYTLLWVGMEKGRRHA